MQVNVLLHYGMRTVQCDELKLLKDYVLHQLHCAEYSIQ